MNPQNPQRYATTQYLLGMGPMPPPTNTELAVAQLQQLQLPEVATKLAVSWVTGSIGCLQEARANIIIHLDSCYHLSRQDVFCVAEQLTPVMQHLEAIFFWKSTSLTAPIQGHYGLQALRMLSASRRYIELRMLKQPLSPHRLRGGKIFRRNVGAVEKRENVLAKTWVQRQEKTERVRTNRARCRYENDLSLASHSENIVEARPPVTRKQVGTEMGGRKVALCHTQRRWTRSENPLSRREAIDFLHGVVALHPQPPSDSDEGEEKFESKTPEQRSKRARGQLAVTETGAAKRTMRTQRSTAKIDSEYEMEADCESIRRIESKKKTENRSMLKIEDVVVSSIYSRGKSRKIEVSNPASRSDGWMILKSFNAPQDPSSMKEELNSVYPHPKFASRWMEWECEGGEARLATPSANAMPVVVWVGTAKEGAYERTEYLSSFAELPLALHCSDLARVKDNSKRDTTLADPQRGCRGDAANAIEGNNERRQSTLSGRIGSAEEGDGREVGRNGTSVGERRDRVSARARGCEISTASNASQADRKTYSISPTLPPARRMSISGNGIRQGRRNAKGTARGGDEETRARGYVPSILASGNLEHPVSPSAYV
ncbi:hypothetical protein R3P38DRAFT_2780882 [Favolaschia claudopus]|uniref:Uncharacterized protein n=1 Tax=Favolaschia claudopus TaxID=2862362 RepID=A0AAW0B8A3_9AGAR